MIEGNATAGQQLGGNAYTHLTGAQTKLVFSGRGSLHAVVVNKPVASATVTIYDGVDTGGDVIAVITLPATLLADSDRYEYNVLVKTGLYVVTTGAGLDVTVCARS